MIGKVVNTLLSQFFSQVLATRSNAFDVQRKVLFSLVHRYSNCPLYQNISLKQEEFQGLLSWSSQDIKQCIARYELCNYQDSILPLVQKGSGITRDCADLSIKTSGTSDANQ